MSTVRAAIVGIPNPKTQKFGGRIQHCVIGDETTILWLEWFCFELPSNLKLFPISMPRLRALFKSLQKQLSLSGFQLASFRAGRATQLHLDGCSLDRLMFAGRWKSLSSLHHYVQEAGAVLAMSRIPAPVASRLQQLVLKVGEHVRPPPMPWPRCRRGTGDDVLSIWAPSVEPEGTSVSSWGSSIDPGAGACRSWVAGPAEPMRAARPGFNPRADLFAFCFYSPTPRPSVVRFPPTATTNRLEGSLGVGFQRLAGWGVIRSLYGGH